MFADSDDELSRTGNLAIELAQQSIGWRATGTSFGGKEFYQNGMRLRCCLCVADYKAGEPHYQDS
jgi:hypothetical protein